MKQIIHRASALAALVLLAACADSTANPTAPASPEVPSGPLTPMAVQTENGATREVFTWVDVLDGARIGCWDGDVQDVVVLSGQLVLRTHQVVTPTGNQHVVSHVMPVDLAGIGEDTGDRYRVQVKDHAVYHEREENDVYFGNSRYLLLMTGETSGATFRVEFRYNWRLNADGSRSRERVEFNCWI